MSESASISSGIAERYATAVFEIAKEDSAIDALKTDIDALDEALSTSEAFRELINSPVITREEHSKAIAAIADKMNLGAVLSNTLALMAQKRRLFVLPALVAALTGKIAAHKGIVTAEVTSVKALTKTQTAKLSKVLADKTGQEVEIKATVDEGLIGGLIVKLGSQMVDTSVRSKLASLQNTMKEVG